MTTPDDIDALAGEYVLGTLDPAERVAVAARRQREPALDRAILAWERRLGPLSRIGRDVAPSADLFEKIEQRIATGAPQTVVPFASQGTNDAARRAANRWRGLAMAASLSTLMLAGALGYRETTRPNPSQQFVGVFNKDDSSPAFMLSVDLATKTMTVRLVNADRPSDKSYQLWIKPDAATPPRSLGVMTTVANTGTFAVTNALATYDVAVLRNATFGVSLEELGGSRSGRPADNALHATLITSQP
jgi:anti-sigma-K factor RskA